MFKLAEKMSKIRDLAEKTAVDAIPDSAKVPEEISSHRWNICASCEHLYKPTHSCKKCGCFMVLKTTLKKAECPIKKWGRYEEELGKDS